jgi:hypothetical protein
MQNVSPDIQGKLNQHLVEVARIMYQHTESEKLESFETIESQVREQVLQTVAPKIGEFFYQKEELPSPKNTEQ